jgi:hypothetical protein
VSDPNGVTVTNTYGNLSRLGLRTHPDGGVESFGCTSEYSGATSHTEPITNAVHYAYDAPQRMTNAICGTAVTGGFVAAMTNRFTSSP